jgi:hypothetical protein
MSSQQHTDLFSIGGVNFADTGFYVNLTESTERRVNVEEQVKKFKITGLNRFEALKDELRQSSATKSQRAVFEEAIKNDNSVIFVAEDDFHILDTIAPYNKPSIPIHEHLSNLKQELDTLDWDVFLFGCCPRAHLIPYTPNISLVNKSTGAWAYLIKKKAMQYILDNFCYYRDYLAIDDILPLLNFRGFKTFCASPITIHHEVGFVSTLNPQGPVNYDNMINGCYAKYLGNYTNNNFLDDYEFTRNTTIVIAGHFVDNFLFYLRYLLHSLPDALKKCKFLIYYDHNPSIDNPVLSLIHYFYNRNDYLTHNIKFVKYGLIDIFKNALDDITTPYFIFLEHDWVFLNKNSINFNSLITAFNKHDFIHSVYFNKDDNNMRGFDICRDSCGNTTPFERDSRVSEIDLITTCRWSNNPAMHRTSKFKEWYNTYLAPVHGNVGHGQHDVEENMIPIYRKAIETSKWNDIRDNWGTFLYGNIGEGPYVGHTDGTRRYTTTARSQPEVNGDKYIEDNSLPQQD